MPTYIPGVYQLDVFFWPVPVFGGKPENSERHFGVILFCFGVVFLCFGVAFLLCSRLLACVMFLVKTQKNTEWRSRYILPGDFFPPSDFHQFYISPEGTRIVVSHGRCT